MAYDPPEHFYDPCGAPPSPTTQIEPAHSNWFVKRDLARDEVTLEVIKDDGRYHLEEINLEVESDTREWYSYRFDDFESLKGETFAVRGLKRDGWHIKTETRTILESNTTHFLISANLDAYENEKRIFSRNWNLEIPRNKV